MNHLKVCPQDKLVVVVLNCAFSWGTITDKQMSQEATTESGATKGSVRVRKTLFPRASGKDIDAVRTVLNTFYSGTHSELTFSIGDRGRRAMPSQFHFPYMEKFGETRAKASDALADLKRGYPRAIEEARTLLGTAFKAEDYPSVDEIEKYFTLEVKFLPMPAGNQIMAALGASVAADVDEHVNDMLQEISNDAKQRLRDAVKRMAETLSRGGKIYDSMPSAINELAKQLPVIAGITDDKELAMMIREVKDTLGGYEGDDFRKSEANKTAVGKAAMDILKRIGG